MYFSPGMYPRVVRMEMLDPIAAAQEPDPGFCGSPDKASASVASRKRAIWVFLAAVMVGASLVYAWMTP